METLNLNLNSAATNLIGGASKIRTRIKDGTIQIRPTDRVNFRPNPDTGEFLRQVKRKKNSATFNMSGVDLAPGTCFTIEASKYGWYDLKTVEALTAGQPGIKVSKD